MHSGPAVAAAAQPLFFFLAVRNTSSHLGVNS
jgi:hypothetical protein